MQFPFSHPRDDANRPDVDAARDAVSQAAADAAAAAAAEHAGLARQAFVDANPARSAMRASVRTFAGSVWELAAAAAVSAANAVIAVAEFDYQGAVDAALRPVGHCQRIGQAERRR